MKIIKLSLILMLTACAQKNDVAVEGIKLSPSFIETGHGTLDIRWWQSFNNEELSELVVRGLQNNLPLKAQALRLKSSKIDTQIAGADNYPDLNLSTSASSNFENFGDINSVSFAVNSSWEVDIWGRVAATENKAYWEYQGREALFRARANLVAGNITNTWLALVSEQEKKLVLEDQFKRTQNALTIMSRRFAMGKNSVTNIWQQQKLLKSIEVQQARNLADLYIHQQTLALWLGVPATDLAKSKITTLPNLPELPSTGIPAEVLSARPDIEQAYAKIQSTNENLAIAISAQYPRITLRGNYSSSKNSMKDIFDNWEGNLIASLAMPIFDAGTKKRVVEQRKLELKAMLLDYQQVWLEAITSVNQVLINEVQFSNVAKNLASQLDLAKRTAKLTTTQYLNGKTNYLNLLRAQESILSLERQLIDANKRLIINRVLLYRELSHGDFSLVTKLTNQKKLTGTHANVYIAD